MTYYKICPLCGARLDPGERCDCEKENAAPVLPTPRAAGAEAPIYTPSFYRVSLQKSNICEGATKMEINRFLLGQAQDEAARIYNLALAIKTAIDFNNQCGTIPDYDGAMSILTGHLQAHHEALLALDGEVVTA